MKERDVLLGPLPTVTWRVITPVPGIFQGELSLGFPGNDDFEVLGLCPVSHHHHSYNEAEDRAIKKLEQLKPGW